MYKKLFIPGPTHVRDSILQAQTAPMIGHRAPEYAELQRSVTAKLQELLYTTQRVFLFASSSTGVMNPVREIAALVRAQYPDVLLVVDAVSAMAGVKIEFDSLGLDVCLAGTQKCFALPPGLAVCAVSERAMERSKQVPNKGYYFDFWVNDKYHQRGQTPATPAISLIQALDRQMDDILADGLESRWARHIEMAELVRGWAKTYFRLFSDERYLSNTVTNVENVRGVDVNALNADLAKRGAMISNGYGELKGKCFRIAHMGDLTLDEVDWLLDHINDILGLV